MLRRSPTSTLFPYTTLFRSKKGLPRWMPSDSAGELDAVHVGHREVGDDGVDARRRVEIGQGSDSRSRAQDVGSARPQKRGQDLCGIVIVVHDEEGEAGEEIQGHGSGHETSVTLRGLLGGSIPEAANTAYCRPRYDCDSSSSTIIATPSTCFGSTS